MGNCGGVCTQNISKLKGDIIMEKLISEKVTSNCPINYNIQKVTYLQRKIKKFLKRKKGQKATATTSKKYKIKRRKNSFNARKEQHKQ